MSFPTPIGSERIIHVSLTGGKGVDLYLVFERSSEGVRETGSVVAQAVLVS